MAQQNSVSHSANGTVQSVKRQIAGYRYPLGFLVVLLTAWTGGVRLFDIPVFILPTPFEIAVSFQGELGNLLPHIGWTFFEALTGWFVGSGIGIVLGFAMAESERIQKSLYPYVIMLRSIPIIAVAPLLILWFGINIYPILAAAIITSFFPALVNSITGFSATDNLTEELMYSYDASRWQVFRHVQIYNALPYIFSALKINVALSLVGAIVGEWLVANEGLGYLILVASNQVNTLLLFRALIVIGVIAATWFTILLYLEDRLIHWEGDTNAGKR